MSRWHHAPCPKCSSSDAFSFKDDDEFGFCFSCNKSSPVNGDFYSPQTKTIDYNMHTMEEISVYDIRGFQERGITKTIAAHFGVHVSYSEDGSIHSHFYPYTDGGVIVAYKERKLPKEFVIHGNFKNIEMFGQAQVTGGKRLIITEGELDAMAVAQAQLTQYQKIYAVCAIPSASMVSKVLLAQREWLRNFGEVILAFDMDEPGKKAVQQAAKIIGFDKVKVASLSEKDPCDVLVKHGAETLIRQLWDAQPFNPAGIVKGEEVWEHFKRRQDTVSLAYPVCLQGVNEKTHGMRLGEIALFTSGTGSGKSTVIKEIVLEILDKTTDSVGMVSLEESIGDSAQKFIGMALKKNLSLEEVDEEELYKGFQQVFADERLIMLDHQGSVGDGSLIDKIEHLALMGCKYIILDHLTIAVSEGAEGKTGNEAVDSVMSSLLKICKKHNVWLGVISHLRKGEKKVFEEGDLPSIDDIKGSGSIKQISFDIIAFARNMTAEMLIERNMIKLRVLKCRFTGQTGNAGVTYYNPDTGRLEAVQPDDFN